MYTTHMSDIKELWRRLEGEIGRLLPGRSPRFRSGVSESAIAAAEKRIGVSFPPDYRQSLLVHDGQDEDPELLWLPWAVRLGPLESLVECWEHDREGYDPAPERFEWLDKSGRARQCHFHPGQVPIAGSTYWDYDRLLLDFVPGPNGSQGQVIGRRDIELFFLCQDFATLLDRTATGLARGTAGFVDGPHELGGLPEIVYRSPRAKKPVSPQAFFA